jgi:hypothetical protein
MLANIKYMRKIICGILIFLGFQGCKSQDNQDDNKTTENLSLPYFGEIAIKPTRDYDTEISLGDYSIPSDLNFYEEVVDKATLIEIELILNVLPTFIDKSEEILIADYHKGGVVKDYIEHHLEVMEKAELEELLKNVNKEEETENQLLSVMKIVRIGFYPDEDSHYAVFDFSIGTDETDYRITIRYNNVGNFDSLEFVS